MGEELRYATLLMCTGKLQIKYVDMDTTFTGSLVEKKWSVCNYIKCTYVSRI